MLLRLRTLARPVLHRLPRPLAAVAAAARPSVAPYTCRGLNTLPTHTFSSTFPRFASLKVNRMTDQHQAGLATAATGSSPPAPASEYVMVYITVPSRDVGRTIANAIVSEKLAACANLVAGLESIYFWDGKVNTDPEELMLIKTRAALVPELTVRVKELHPCIECEVVAVPIVGGSASYLQWVADSTKKPDS